MRSEITKTADALIQKYQEDVLDNGMDWDLLTNPEHLRTLATLAELRGAFDTWNLEDMVETVPNDEVRQMLIALNEVYYARPVDDNVDSDNALGVFLAANVPA